MGVLNTKLTYLYRDGSNYKQWDDVVLAGAVDPEMIRRHLWEGDFFIPRRLHRLPHWECSDLWAGACPPCKTDSPE